MVRSITNTIIRYRYSDDKRCCTRKKTVVLKFTHCIMHVEQHLFRLFWTEKTLELAAMLNNRQQ